MRIEAVIFDYGNVLSLPQAFPVVEEMANRCGVTPERFEQHYWQSRLDYDRGDLDGITYWRGVARGCACTLSDAQIEELIEIDNRGWSQPNDRVVEVAHALPSRGYKTAILSNMPPDFRAWLDQGVTWLPPFHHHTYSCELRVVKPDVAIYEHSYKGLGISPGACLFIDDRQVNIDTAASLGMKTILFSNTETVLSQLEMHLSGSSAKA